jgi:hypothetical protein
MSIPFMIFDKLEYVSRQNQAGPIIKVCLSPDLACSSPENTFPVRLNWPLVTSAPMQVQFTSSSSSMHHVPYQSHFAQPASEEPEHYVEKIP